MEISPLEEREMKNVPTGPECCDRLLTKLPNNPLNKLHNSLFDVCHVLPWALRALRGELFVRWWGEVLNCVHDGCHSTHGDGF